MRPFLKSSIFSLLLILSAYDAFAIVKCGVRFMDGRDMSCQDGAVCVYQGPPTWMSCRCKTPAGEDVCVPVKTAPARPKQGQMFPPPGGPGRGDQAPSPADRLKAAAEFRRSGMSAFKNGGFDGAIIDWNKAIALDPDLSEELTGLLARVYGKRAVALYRAGDYSGSLADFDEALKLSPDDADLRRARSIVAKAREREPERSPLETASKTGAPGFQVGKESGFSLDQYRQYLVYVIAWFALSLLGLFSAGYVTFSENRNEARSTGKNSDPFAVNSYREFAGKFLSGLDMRTAVLLLTGLAFGLLAFFYFYFVIKSAWKELAGKGESGFAGLVPPIESAARPPERTQDRAVPVLVERAAAMIYEGRYQDALEILSQKPYTQLDLDYYNLFLEIYIRLGDFSRARLMLTQIDRELRDKPDSRPAYAKYLSLAQTCRDKGEAALARQLKEASVDSAIRSVPVGETPQELYSLALSLEKEGEYDLALKLYRVFVLAGRAYLDVQERFDALKDRPAAQPPIVKVVTSRQAPKTNAQAIGLVLDGRFEIKGDLGEGAMGVVFEGWDRRQNNKVAIKKMHTWLKAYPEEYGRFKQEAEIVGRLKHPNIVGVRGVIEQDGDIYLVFDFVDGRPASVVLKERKRFPLNECKEIFKGVCGAVHYAHKNNVIHRDLKPSNIMLDANFHAMVVDFGLASELRESLTRVTHQTMSGTPAYMAPEQNVGIVKREADIYAMGVCLYEMLTGELPFRGPDTMKLKKEKDYREVTSQFPWLPGGVDALLARALEPEPSQRLDDALDFYDALKDL